MARWWHRGDEGAASMTVAILFFGVFALLMLGVQAGVYWHARQRAEAAADQAAAVAARVDSSPSSGEAAGYAFLDGAPLDNADVSVTRGSDEARATVTGTAPALIMGITWEVTAHATVEVERFIPEPDRR